MRRYNPSVPGQTAVNEPQPSIFHVHCRRTLLLLFCCCRFRSFCSSSHSLCGCIVNNMTSPFVLISLCFLFA